MTVHHTASANDYSAADVPRLLRGFYAYHVKSNGWSDIGYNFLVDKYGRIWEGRAGGVTRAVMGSHAGGFNTGTVGISMIGTYDTVAPSAAARESVAQLAAWRLSAAGKDPTGNVRVYSAGSTRFADGLLVTLPRIFGHRDVSTTSCPGAKGMTALPGIRARAAGLVAGMPPVTAAPVPDEEVVPVPKPVTPPVLPPAVPPSPDGLTVLAPLSVATGASVPLTISGGAGGAAVEVWFSRRGDLTSSRRREGRFAADGTFRTATSRNDVYTVFAVSGARTSGRATTSVGALPPLVRAAPPSAAGHRPGCRGRRQLGPRHGQRSGGSPVDLWLRKRGRAGWSRLAAGRLDTSGRWLTRYLGDDDVDYWASSQGCRHRTAARWSRRSYAAPRAPPTVRGSSSRAGRAPVTRWSSSPGAAAPPASCAPLCSPTAPAPSVRPTPLTTSTSTGPSRPAAWAPSSAPLSRRRRWAPPQPGAGPRGASC